MERFRRACSLLDDKSWTLAARSLREEDRGREATWSWVDSGSYDVLLGSKLLEEARELPEVSSGSWSDAEFNSFLFLRLMGDPPRDLGVEEGAWIGGRGSDGRVCSFGNPS
jgi:hypothetical protein